MEKSPNDDRDLFAENIYNPNLSVPKKLDLRNLMNKVRNQEDTSKCGAFSASAIKEWQEKKEIGFHGLFSVDYIYNKRKEKDKEGMYARNIMKILHKYGAIPETSYSNEDSDDIMAGGFKIKGYAQVKTILECKKALFKNGPCLISFPTYNKKEKMWDPSGGEFSGGHAMVIVGYTKDSFILRNSWGKLWNDEGYCYYPFNEWGAHWEVWTCIDDESPKISKMANCMAGFQKCFGR
jgi:C1A family cysteine protease